MNNCVYGSASEDIAKIYHDDAYRLGKAIAAAGFGMVFGGGKFGLMGSAARGARSAGGKVIGIAPHFFEPNGVLFEDCGEFHFTDTMRERKQKMEELSDAFVVMPGGIGTFEEFLEILTLRQLQRHDKPIFVLDTNGYYADLRKMLDHASEEGFISRSVTRLPLLDESGSRPALVEFISDPEEIVARIKTALGC